MPQRGALDEPDRWQAFHSNNPLENPSTGAQPLWRIALLKRVNTAFTLWCQERSLAWMDGLFGWDGQPRRGFIEGFRLGKPGGQ